MLVTDKIYFTSTLIAGAGCSSDTFRAWRNRNGLFPETSGGKWNKFSIIDIFVAALVSDLTRTGMSAQFAVEASMKAAPLLEKLFDMPLTEHEVLWPTDMLSQIEQKLWPEKTNYAVLHFYRNRPSGQVQIELLSSQTAAENILRGKEISTIVNLRYLSRAVLSSMAIEDSELEIDGKRRVRAGHQKLNSHAVTRDQVRRLKAGD
ncbi:hypothetical protein [Bradyrhizobium japonicum]|uniref:hypothetical protein n=1 Tax=Bradyrhizobium japonicum TaxID=375 RepID=UPI0003FA3752|nr:hypothetical protein [Bradyrhizobium japonicum]WLB91302.1 hypothetical protein QIH91_13320 [Bradyrhizobium japonicum USDA 135]